MISYCCIIIINIEMLNIPNTLLILIIIILFKVLTLVKVLYFLFEMGLYFSSNKKFMCCE